MHNFRSICFLVLGLVISGQILAQGDCVYPILFLHGWGGNAHSWADVYTHPEVENIWGILDRDYTKSVTQGLDTYQEIDSLDPSHIYNAVINGSVATDLESDILLHADFDNAPAIISDGCMYAINLDNSWNNDTNYIKLIHSSDPNPKYPESFVGESGSSESSAFKQGYVLGQAIAKVLALTGKEKVILVAHSMGGLMAREYLQRSFDGGLTHAWWVDPLQPDGHKIAKLLTVGTPHRGSNRANINDPSGASLAGTIGFNLASEAVRDLRFSYVTTSTTFPAAYLYGLAEPDIPQIAPEDYSNVDVNADGSELDTIIGINISGLHPSMNEANVWDGSYANPILPLPTNLKYTYYVSDVDFGFFCILPDETDGIVRADRQWLYSKNDPLADGSTANYLSGMSYPSPTENSELMKPHFFSDRWTSYSSRHVEALATSVPLCSTGDWQTADVNAVMAGIDEGDYPYFASDILTDKWYFGQPQSRADIVPPDSYDLGGVTVQNGEERLVDSDWFRFEVQSIQDLELKFIKSSVATDSRVDLVGSDSLMSLYSNSVTNLLFQFQISTTDTTTQLLAENLLPGSYYLRITHDLRSLSAIQQAEAWHNPYEFILLTQPGDCIADLDLTGIHLNSGVYLAGQSIQANTLVNSFEQVGFQANLNIDLLPGFEVKPNAIFEIKMEGCN